MSKVYLCSLLGKAIVESEIQDILTLIKVDPAKVKLKKGDDMAYAQNEKLNITLIFQPDFALLYPLVESPRELTPATLERVEKVKEYPEGTLFLAAIVCGSNYLFDNGYYIKYDFRVDETITIQEIYEKLGEPYIVNERHRAIGWMVGEQDYNFGYNKENSIIDEINFSFLC